jgi:hypothetical protein
MSESIPRNRSRPRERLRHLHDPEGDSKAELLGCGRHIHHGALGKHFEDRSGISVDRRRHCISLVRLTPDADGARLSARHRNVAADRADSRQSVGLTRIVSGSYAAQPLNDLVDAVDDVYIVCHYVVGDMVA